MNFSNLKKGLGLVVVLASSHAAFAYGGWAAIVFNPSSGAWGSYHGASSRAEAEQAAMSECGYDCAGVDPYTLESGASGLKETYVRDGWIAYARSATTSRWATSGDHSSQEAAESQALAKCSQNASDCYIVRSVSSYTSYEDIDGTHSN
jgi:hypothetical protein